MTAKWAYLLWVVIMIRFVVFVAPPSPTSFQNLLKPKVAAEQVLSQNRLDYRTVYSAASPQDLFPTPVTTDPTVPTVVPVAESGPNLWHCVFLAWLTGVILLTIRFFVGVSRVSRLIRESRQASSELVRRFNSIKDQFGMNSDVSLRVSNELDTPAMAGLFRPVVLVPEWFEAKLDHQQQAIVFTHELVHIRRLDAWIQLVTRMIMTLHWFNPLVWWTWKKIADQRELSCDQLAIERLNSVHPECDTQALQRRYGNTILNISIYSRTNSQGKRHLAPVLIGGFTSHDKSLIKQRIAMLLKRKSHSRFSFAFAAVAISLLAAVGFTSAQTESSNENQSKDLVYKLAGSDDENGAIYAQPVFAAPASKHSQHIITMYQGETIELVCPFVVPETSNENPEIVNVVPKSPKVLTVTAKAIGDSIIHISDPEHRMRVKKIRVLPDVSDLRSKVSNQFPEANISLHVRGDGIVYLVGYGDEELAAKVENFAKSQTTLPISNDISDKDVVRVECKTFEVSRTKLAAIHNAWAPLASFSPQPIDTIADAVDGTHQSDKVAIALIQDSKVIDLVAVLEELEIATQLNSPTLVTIEGLTAEFRNGGEIPIRVRQATGKDKIEFREFGTKIELTPVLRGGDDLLLEVRAEVSEVDHSRTSDSGIPFFRLRRINTGISMSIGSTLCMVSDYRSKGKAEKEDTELVFFFTPSVLERETVRAEPPAKTAELKLRKVEIK